MSRIMWRKTPQPPRSRSRQDSGTAQDWDALAYDEQLIQSIPQVREALAVRRAMELRQEHKSSSAATAAERCTTPESPAASKAVDKAPLDPGAAPGAPLRHAPMAAASSAKRQSLVSTVPTASSVYSASPDLDNYRCNKDLPPPLFADRNGAHETSTPAPAAGARKKSSIPVRRQGNGHLSQPGHSAPVTAPAPSGFSPAPRQQRDHPSETNDALGTSPDEMRAALAISSPTSSSTPTSRDNPLRSHPTSPDPYDSDGSDEPYDDLDLSYLSFAGRRNLPALGISLPAREPWQGASGAANLMTPITDVTPAATLAAQSTGSVSPVSQSHDYSLPNNGRPSQRSAAAFDADAVSPISEASEPDVSHSKASDKGANPPLQGRIYTLSSGPGDDDDDDDAIHSPSTLQGSPGLTMTDFDDAASYRPPVPRKNSTRPARKPVDELPELPPRSDTPSSVGSAIRRKKIRGDDEWIDRSLPPSAAEYHTSIDPVGPKSEYDWSAQEEAEALIASRRNRRHLTPETAATPRRNVSAPADMPDPVTSRFSWSTAQQSPSMSSPKAEDTPPVPPLKHGFAARPRSPEQPPIDKDVYSWGGKPPVWVMDREKHGYHHSDDNQPQHVYAPYRNPETPERTPPPVHYARSDVSRESARTPVNDNSIMNRTRPLTRRAEDGSYTPREETGEGSSHAIVHPTVQRQIKRKPTPSEMFSQQSLSPPASPPRSSSGTEKELPKAPIELDSIDYITELEAKIDILDLRILNISRVIQKRKDTESDPIKFDLAARKREKEEIASMERQLDDVKLQKQETGVKLHRAWKRREQEACTALWVRRRGN